MRLGHLLQINKFMQLNRNTLLQLSLALALCLAACNGASNSGGVADSTADKMKSAEGKVEEAASQASTAVKEALKSNPDSSFVTDVAAGNMEEIVVLQAGMDKGSNKTLKAHAKMMLKDHESLKKSLADYAGKHGYTLPADDGGAGQKDVDNMNGKAGAEWDKAWTSFMFDAHEKVIGKFEGAKGQMKDDELKTMITATLPTLHSHLDMMKSLQEKLK
jgi:putative membrane protein